MFPLKNRKIVGYTFGVPTFYSNFHLGTDYGKENEVIYAPFAGVVTKAFGKEGGNTILFKPDARPELIRMLHCKKILKVGHVEEGEEIGIVGYTGLVSPPGPAGSHTHLDISINGKLDIYNHKNFTDPEKYDWVGKSNLMLVYKFDDNPTVYILADDATLVGATAQGLSKVLGDRPQKLITLPASQRSNFVVSTGVIN